MYLLKSSVNKMIWHFCVDIVDYCIEPAGGEKIFDLTDYPKVKSLDKLQLLQINQLLNPWKLKKWSLFRYFTSIAALHILLGATITQYFDIPSSSKISVIVAVGPETKPLLFYQCIYLSVLSNCQLPSQIFHARIFDKKTA